MLGEHDWLACWPELRIQGRLKPVGVMDYLIVVMSVV
jgi:hypothetical protein